MKPSQLATHLKPKHLEHEDKALQFFQRCLKSYDTQSSTLPDFAELNGRSSEASFWGFSVATEVEATYCWRNTSFSWCSKNVWNNTWKTKKHPLSADAIWRCLENIAKDLKKQILEKIMQCGRLAIQLGESTDVFNVAYPTVVARFCVDIEIIKKLSH